MDVPAIGISTFGIGADTARANLQAWRSRRNFPKIAQIGLVVLVLAVGLTLRRMIDRIPMAGFPGTLAGALLEMAIIVASTLLVFCILGMPPGPPRHGSKIPSARLSADRGERRGSTANRWSNPRSIRNGGHVTKERLDLGDCGHPLLTG